MVQMNSDQISTTSFSTMSLVSCGTATSYDCIKETEWLKLETWVYRYGSYGTVSSRFEWLKVPSNTDIDVFAIGLNSNFSPTPGTESLSYKYDLCDPLSGVCTTFENPKSVADKRDGGGYAFKIDLNNNPYHRNHRGYMKYSFTPNVSNAIVADAYSHYAHQVRTFSINPSITMPLGGGLSLSYGNDFSYVHGHAQLKPW
ncbi:hypothetical protein [Paenibacillus harenae]|uniref:hypothetical protein n=1 Tax=Paenibacillus harenae TaxID=306543 RepID=UPI0012EB9575|nr:hypothetical protein [Paenibacillus harenae]